MSGPPRVRSMNMAVGDPEARPVLVPSGNKARPVDGRKPVKKSVPETEKKPVPHSNPQCVWVSPPISKRQDHHQALLKNLSMNASCSSDASSTDSSTHSSGASSSGKVVRRVRKKQASPKTEKVSTDNVVAPDNAVEADSTDSLEGKKRCAWVTPNTGISTPSCS
ncbi:hypothetical protein SESBI_22265 [Sesbania bispinosa]|nr:hypothetical protein SESBI_22265 [Sesbania bispinosa]